MLATPIEVKKALKEGTYKKNYRFVVLNDDGTEDFTIDNDNLVSESVSIDERMCSGDTLKFGLCEGSSLEFQYFGKPNITGRRVQVFVDAYFKPQYTTMGQLVVNDSHLHYTVTLAGIYRFYVEPDDASNVTYINRVIEGNTDNRERHYFETYADGHKEVSFGCLVDDELYLHGTTGGAATIQKYEDNYTIPLGFFDVKNCSRQASTGIIKASCYNKLMSDYLDAKANDLIQDIQSDVGDADKITIATVQSMLLSDYEITEKEQTVEVHYTSAEITGSPSSPTFKINGSSITYYPAIDNKFMECTNALQNKRFRLAISEYCRKLSESMEELKDAITDNIQNPEAYINSLSESSIQTYFGFYVYFLDGTTGRYYLDGDILRPILTPGPDIIGDVTKLKYLSNVGYIDFYYPYQFRGISANNDQATIWTSDISLDEDDIEIFMMDLDSIEGVEISKTDLADVTLRDIVSANYELHCTFGQLSRVTDLFSGVELNSGGLYPSETLYPADGLYPNSNTDGQGIHPYPSEYSQLWTDTMGEQSFRYLIITYKTLDENNQEVDAVLQRTVNADGTTDYNMSDNWLFRNLVWTAADVGDYADAMVLKMQNIRWFPFEMWAAGLPYVETGDAIEITDREGNTHNSYIFQRQLQGIQNLQDTYVNGELDIF